MGPSLSNPYSCSASSSSIWKSGWLTYLVFTTNLFLSGPTCTEKQPWGAIWLFFFFFFSWWSSSSFSDSDFSFKCGLEVNRQRSHALKIMFCFHFPFARSISILDKSCNNPIWKLRQIVIIWENNKTHVYIFNQGLVEFYLAVCLSCYKPNTCLIPKKRKYIYKKYRRYGIRYACHPIRCLWREWLNLYGVIISSLILVIYG